MRGLLAIFSVFVLSACGSAERMILLEVDADETLLASIVTAKVEVFGDGPLPVSEDSFAVTGVRPDCLPFSVAIAPEPGNEDSELRICVTLGLGDVERTKCRRTRLLEGTRGLLIEMEDACLDRDCSSEETTLELPKIDLEEAEKRIENTQCKARPEEVGPIECVARGGCYFEEAANRACRSCPAPTSVVPPAEPAPPELPLFPVMTPCPPGWSESGTPVICEPWTIDDAPNCPPGQVRYPSHTACEGFGATCPSGQYAENFPAGRPLIHVAAGESLSAALAGAPDHAVVLLERGNHPGANLRIERPVSVIGACVETVLSADVTITSSAVELRDLGARSLAVDGGSARLSRVTFSGAAGPGLRIRGDVSARELVIEASDGFGVELESGTLTATSVVITRATGAAVRVASGARAELEDSALVDTRAGATGAGFAIDSGGRVRWVRSIAERPRGFGIHLTGGSATLEQSIVRNVGPRVDREGDGIRVLGGAAVRLNRMLIEHASRAGMYVNEGSSAVFTDLVVRNIETDPAGGSNGQALLASSGGTLDGTRVYIQHASRRAIHLQVSARFEDLIVRDTTAERNEGYGMVITDGASVVLTRAELSRNPEAAISLRAEGTRLEIEDLSIPAPEDSSSSMPQSQGAGIDLEPGTELILRRARIMKATGAGIRVRTGERIHASLNLEDLTISDTESTGNADNGFGLIIGGINENLDGDDPVTLILKRGKFERNRVAGIGISRTMDAQLEDIIIHDTRPGAASKEYGAGLAIAASSVVRATRIELLRNTEVGVFAGLIGLGNSENPSIAELSHVRIEETACTKDQARCSFFHGAGAGVAQTGRMTLSQFLIRNNAATGAGQYYSGSSIDLIDGEISMNPIGVSIYESDYDLARVIRGVVFRDNQADIYVP
jgi:hypothetical protein